MDDENRNSKSGRVSNAPLASTELHLNGGEGGRRLIRAGERSTREAKLTREQDDTRRGRHRLPCNLTRSAFLNKDSSIIRPETVGDNSKEGHAKNKEERERECS